MRWNFEMFLHAAIVVPVLLLARLVHAVAHLWARCVDYVNRPDARSQTARRRRLRRFSAA